MRNKSCNQSILDSLSRVMGDGAIIEYAIWKTALMFLDTGKNRRERIMDYLEEEVNKWIKE